MRLFSLGRLCVWFYLCEWGFGIEHYKDFTTIGIGPFDIWWDHPAER